MRTTLQVATEPTIEPVSVTLAKQHARIDTTIDDETLLPSYIAAARAMAEMYLSRALITQTLLWTVLPESPLRPDWSFLRHPLQLPRGPVQSITTVTALDDRGNATTITAATLPLATAGDLAGYLADLTLAPARLTVGRQTILTDGRTLHEAATQHLQVRFVAGYGALATAVPKPIVQAILLIVSFLYEHRGDAPAEMPQAAQWLLDPYRIHWIV